MKLHTKPLPKTHHPLRQSPPSPKAQRTQPSVTSQESKYCVQPTMPPPQQSNQAKMSEVQVQPKLTEVPRTNRLCGHLHQYKSSNAMSSSSKSKMKTGKGISKMKLQRRRSWPWSGKRSRGSAKSKKPSQGGKQQFSMPKPKDSTLTGREQGLQSFSTTLRSFANRSRVKGPRSNSHTTTITHRPHLCHTSKIHNLNTRHLHYRESIFNPHRNMPPQTQKNFGRPSTVSTLAPTLSSCSTT
jgi:hypothetical protein